jgi:serine/threonine-protein kinase RsbW
MKSQKVFKRHVNELQSIFSFLKGNWNELNVKDGVQMEMQLSVEELFMNMVRHNSSADGDIEVLVERKEDKIMISLCDFEEVPFDITKAEEIDFEEYFKQKKFGGLGLHLVKELMDEIKFNHSDGISTITMTKQM